MKKIEAATLEEAYTQAAQAFNCSVTQLEVTVVQHPSRGVLGLFAKPAVIVAMLPEGVVPQAVIPQPREADKPAAQPSPQEPKAPDPSSLTDHTFLDEAPAPEAKPERTLQKPPVRASAAPVKMTDESRALCQELQSRLNALFANTCYRINPIEVSMYDDKTVRVFFDGEDAALLIGRDGYRYKALSYILFNWINPQYGYLLRLEIAEFLQNQEEMITRYLEPVMEAIAQNGRGQTRVLDGVLVQIALRELRTAFPNKYVAIKTTPDGGKFVVVNDFVRKY